MEGISQEAISLAGHLKLDNLILVYDNNKISIDGSTDLSFSDNTNLRFKSVNWNVFSGDGHNHKNIRDLFKKSQKSNKPNLLNFKTTIGFGSPNKSTKPSHGSPLGAGEIVTKKSLIGKRHLFIFLSALKEWRQSSNRNLKIYTQSKKSLKNIKGLKNFSNKVIKLFDTVSSEFKDFNSTS